MSDPHFADESIVGRDIDSYRVVSELGAGAMGEVYLADDLELGRRVALKLLPEVLADDPDLVRRFIEEARAASSLNHPNILTVHRVGEFKGRRYIATEFIDGETLRQRIARGPLPEREAVEIAIQATSALAAAHAAGIVHRDVKPENLMIRRDGYVKVLDFGLAKLTEGERLPPLAGTGSRPGLTIAGLAMGTYGYMAPEQAAGEKVDARADLFALAVVLREMLVGASPKQPTPALAADVGHPALQAIVARGLAPDRAERYQSAAALKADLEAVLHAPAAPVAQAVAGGRWRLWGAAVAVGVVSAALLVWQMLSSPASSAIHSIAVMPFDVTDADRSDQTYLSIGLAEAITTRLGELQPLKVMPSATARHFVGTTRGADDIGRELGVEAVLTGSVLRADERLRITLKLTRVSDGHQVWAGSFDQRITDVFAMQHSITEAVTSNLMLGIAAPARHARRETADTAAYEIYLRAREQWARRTPAAIRSAIDMFNDVVKRDPTFAPAYAGLANSYALTASGLRPEERYPKARDAAIKALELDEGLAEAHNALAFINYKLEWKWDIADREFKRAIALEPAYVLAQHWYAEYLSVIGRHDASLAGFVVARQLDPYSLSIIVDQALAMIRARKYADAETVARAGLERDARSAALHNTLYNALWRLKRHDEAFAALVQSHVLSGADEPTIASMRDAFARGGFVELAKHDVKDLIDADRTNRILQSYFGRQSMASMIARQYAVIGDADQAMTWLAEAVRRRDDGPLSMRTLDYWDPYRADPRFQALERIVGMP